MSKDNSSNYPIRIETSVKYIEWNDRIVLKVRFCDGENLTRTHGIMLYPLDYGDRGSIESRPLEKHGVSLRRKSNGYRFFTDPSSLEDIFLSLEFTDDEIEYGRYALSYGRLMWDKLQRLGFEVK